MPIYWAALGIRCLLWALYLFLLNPTDTGIFLHFSDEGSETGSLSLLPAVTLPTSGRAKMQTKVCPTPKSVSSPQGHTASLLTRRHLHHVHGIGFVLLRHHVP